MCTVLEVSKSGFYDGFNRPESRRSKRHHQLTQRILHIHKGNRRIYGSPRIHDELVDEGEVVGENTVAMLMKKAGIQSRMRKRFVVTTDSKHSLKPAKNLLNRDFKPTCPNEKWVSDVTAIATREGSLYLATLMDLYSRMIIGWAMGSRNTTQLVSDALSMAVNNRKDVSGVLLHSDRGVQYASTDYQQKLLANDIVCSMSRKGNCWDNAPMESFYHSLKTEWVYFENYTTRSEARSSLFEYIELFYNRKRRHSSINYQSPLNYEKSTCVY